MKNRLLIIVAVALVLAFPLGAFAMKGMDHGNMKDMDHSSTEQMDHGKMKDMDHGGMLLDKDTIMIGEEVADGVKAMAHIKDVGAAMAKMKMQETHHFAVMFMDAETAKMIETGTVAVKIEDPAGKESGPVKLMGMEGHFGADLTLSEKGEYHFKLGTKLADGKKRQYDFHYTVK